ncbi:redoxin domain-containing protein [Subtercola vilae]|uniref:Thioredoxin domain-containing protein n=1 Tax=Subtercola vilae TaxID=2056433 RepID=A0A4T2CEB5_9MICO|nr:redoxin domain-containing protein [Subtercola vilae]TIH40628.1 hypothetical protein D4765_01185 [Subtercola vilae]
MPDKAEEDETHDRDTGDPSIRVPSVTTKRRGSVWMLWLTGAVTVAVAVALVIVYGSAQAQPASADVMPGITQATADLLQLDGTDQPGVAAPAFSLTDQNGAPMTLNQFQGRSVVLTFNDDQCTDLCTLLAEDVLAANTDLGAAQNTVAFVSLNANPYFPAPATVKQWSDQQGLGNTANWYFGTGTPGVLSAVAAAYGVPIQLDPADRTVQHGTEIFFIDPSGNETRLGEFGTESADTAPFAYAVARVADDLLPAGERTTVSGHGVLSANTDNAELGSTPAPVELPKLSDPSTTVSTRADDGKYTVINFWGSTCTACATEMPALESEYRLLGGRVAFVGVDVDDKTAAGGAFTQRFGTTYDVVSDATGAVAGRYAITGLPYTVVLDPGGQVVIRHPGAFTQDQLDYLLRSLG